jgi:hypothetical protein
MEIVWPSVIALMAVGGVVGLVLGLFLCIKAAREPHPIEILLASCPPPPPMPPLVAAYLAAQRLQQDQSLPRPTFIPPPTIH